MKIARVMFVRSVQLPSGAWVTAVTAAEHRIELDGARRFVVVDGREIPCAHVLGIDYDTDTQPESAPLKCPECGEECADARGLGAHRRHQHGVRGTSRAVAS